MLQHFACEKLHLKLFLRYTICNCNGEEMVGIDNNNNDWWQTNENKTKKNVEKRWCDSRENNGFVELSSPEIVDGDFRCNELILSCDSHSDCLV